MNIMDREHLNLLMQLDVHSVEKMNNISPSLAELEFAYIHSVCILADREDLDRRLALAMSLSALEKIWADAIMCI